MEPDGGGHGPDYLAGDSVTTPMDGGVGARFRELAIRARQAGVAGEDLFAAPYSGGVIEALAGG